MKAPRELPRSIANPPPEREAHADLDDATVRSYATATCIAWLVFSGMHLAGGRPLTAAAHAGAAAVSLASRFLVGARAGGRPAAIVTLAGGSLAGLGCAAVLSGDPGGPAVTLLALVPLLTGVIRSAPLRRAILVLSIATIAAVPVVATHTAALEPLHLGVLESILLSVGLGVLVYRFGSEWRLRSDEQVARLAQQQAELEAHRARLEESTAELSAARDEAVRASAAKSQFVAMTSHEIRGPLNGLVGLSHALSDTELSAHQRGIVQALRSSSDALTKVVGDLLDLARVEAGKVELLPSKVDVRALAEDVVDTFAAGTLDRDVELAAVVDEAVPEALIFDGTRLRQVLSNLVGNAIKFTERGHVLLSVAMAQDSLRIEVTDTGRGISADDRDRLFAPFEQVSDRLLDRQAGTGLGLWLARSFVDAMGGSLVVRSELGVGSTFAVSLPCRSEPPTEGDRASLLPPGKLLGVGSSPVAGRALLAAAARLGLVGELARPDEIATLPAGVHDFVVLDVDDPAQEDLLRGISRVPRQPRGLVLAASPRRLARAEELSRRHKLRGVLLKPMRASRLAALLSGDAAQAARPSSSGQLLLGQILVVDDEPINRTVARHLATPLGLSVAEASSGAEALDWLEANTCDVVLMDLHMAGMDGAEAAARIRARHGASPILIGYSGAVRDEERARFLEAGVLDVLGKPLERTTFETALRAAVGRARRRQTRAGDAGRGSSITRAAARDLEALPPRSIAAAELRAEALGLGRPPDAPALEHARFEELVKFVGEPTAKKMAADFLLEVEARVLSLTAAARSGSGSEVVAVAHRLASAAATFGMSALADACRAAEAAAPHASAADLLRLGEGVERALPPSRTALSRALAEPPR